MSTVLSEAFLRRMRPEDRASLGKAGVTATEAQSKWQKGEERKMHDAFEQWLALHRSELYWDHSRMDKPTSNRVGHPDFVIQHGNRVTNIELKAPGGKLTDKQREVHDWIKAAGGQVYVCYSAAEAIDVVRLELLAGSRR